MVAEADRDALIHRRIALGTSSNYIGKILPLAAGFFLTPFILREVGASTYGLWILVGAVLQYGTLLDLGIPSAVIKYVAEHKAKGDMEEAHALVATALWMFALIGLGIAAIAAALAPLFALTFGIPTNERATASWLVVLMGINIGVSLPCSTATAVLRGLQRFELGNVVALMGTFISVATTVIILLRGGGILGMVAAGIPITILMQIPAILLINRAAPDLHFGWRGARRSLARKVFSYSAATFIIQLGGQVQAKTDSIVIGAFMPVASVTPYSFALRLSEIPQILTDQFMKLLLPLASELDAGNDRARLRAVYVTGTRLTLALFLPVACVVVLLGPQILTAWVGGRYASYAYLVIILAIAIGVDISLWPAGSVLQGMARQRPLAILTACSAVVNLVLSIILIQPYGLAGVAFGTLVPSAIEAVLVFAVAMRLLGVSLKVVLREMLSPVLAPALPTAFGLLLVSRTVRLSSLPLLLIAAAAAVLTYVVVYIGVGASAYERQAYQGLARDGIRFARGWVGQS